MEQTNARTNDDKMKMFQFAVERLTSKMKDLLWYAEHGTDEMKREIYRTERWEDLDRPNAIAARYLEDVKKLMGRDGENWKGFYSGILACSRFLGETVHHGDFSMFDEDGSFEKEISSPLDFKMQFAEEGASKKEIGVWGYEMMPPAIVYHPIGKMVNGKVEVELDEGELGEGEPTPFRNEDGDWSY